MLQQVLPAGDRAGRPQKRHAHGCLLETSWNRRFQSTQGDGLTIIKLQEVRFSTLSAVLPISRSSLSR